MKKIFAFVLCVTMVFGMFAGLTAGAAETPVIEGTEVTDLTWANGTYYGSVGNGNGKYVYTSLKIEKGQKVQFELGGVWNLWVYPAVNGVATGEYRGGNSTKKINNGEIMEFAENVDELMITAYIEGTPALTVESAEFATMDLKFYRITPPIVFGGVVANDLTWANGTYYGSVGNGNGKYVYTSLKIAKGEKVQFELGGQWNLWVYPAVNGVATGEYRGGNSVKKINNGEILEFAENVDELMITAYIEGTPALTVESAEFATMDLKFYRIAPNSTLVDDLTWANGTYYGSVGSGNGKYVYTSLKFEKGQKVQFELGGKWNLWVYPAVDGVATGEYRGGNSTKKITNGEILTFAEDVNELMITAYIEGTPALTVESEEFKTMDLRFFTITDVEEDDDDDKEEVTLKDGVLEDLTWEKGAMYDSFKDLPTTRRYTEIAVKGGDKLYVKMPSENWVLWLYAYDDAGYIKYYDKCEIDSVYAIEAVNGRTPTKVYVSAVPNPDRALEDNQWNFDFQISRNVPFAGQDEEEGNKPDASGLIWNKGAFYDTPSPNTSLATTRRYTVMDVAAGDVIKFTMPSKNWRIWVYPADEVGSINYFEAKDGMEYTVKDISGRTPTKLRITACPNPDGSLTDALWKKFDVTIAKTTVTPPVIENPKTSDFSIALPMVALISTAALVSGVVVLRKKREI